MTRIIGISGKKQSGKNTAANFLHGLALKGNGLAPDFSIDAAGELVVLTDSGWGVFDITRKDTAFVEYADLNMWPHVKLYSFADGLKGLCVEFFGLKPEQAYGTDDEKNTKTKVKWEDTPTWQNSSLNLNRGFMTSRELLQYFGTNVMRKMHKDVWVEHTVNKIKREQTELAIIADVRFPNEVEAILSAGGEVIKLQRAPLKDNHESETALDEGNFDQSKFSYMIPSGSIKGLCSALESIFLKGSTC
jgi:hypothetical protein